MNSMITNFIDTLLAKEKSKQTEENEPTVTKEISYANHSISAFDFI